MAKSNSKRYQNIINDQNFLVQDPEKGEPVIPCMDVYKDKFQSDGSPDNIKLRIVVRGDLKNKELVVDTWLPTASMRTLKYFLADLVKHNSRLHLLDFIGKFLQEKVKKRVFLKLDRRYGDYSP